ncbi:MAG: C25 family cysteine peptidase [Candidatus Poribacteria bacterium]|nr:C25 family cysteine peptidase [Candidatus Poribacteria bacterium]
MKTLALYRQDALEKTYPNDAARLLEAIDSFARRRGAKTLEVGSICRELQDAPDNACAKALKKAAQAETNAPLDALVLIGDENILPMWTVNILQAWAVGGRGRGRVVHTDAFYGGLSGGALPDTPVSRVMGNADAVVRQLNGGQARGLEAAVLCSEDTRIHLETQRFLEELSQNGHRVDAIGRMKEAGGQERLDQYDLIIHFGHGSARSISNRWGEDFASSKGLPALPRRPIAIVDGCATTPPGSPLLRAFLNNGCRAYIGSGATVYGMTPARYTNQLVMHFLDAYKENPDWHIARLLLAARAQYARVNCLEKPLAELEKVGRVSADGEMDIHLATFLGWGSYGAPFARLGKGEARPAFKKLPLVTEARVLKAPGGHVETAFQQESPTQQPILFLRADWPAEASSGLVVRVSQNGKVLHELHGGTEIVYQHLKDICVGGYDDGEIYRAYWLLPLESAAESQQLRVELTFSEGEAAVLTESAVELWPEWEVVEPPSD